MKRQCTVPLHSTHRLLHERDEARASLLQGKGAAGRARRRRHCLGCYRQGCCHLGICHLNILASRRCGDGGGSECCGGAPAARGAARSGRGGDRLSSREWAEGSCAGGGHSKLQASGRAQAGACAEGAAPARADPPSSTGLGAAATAGRHGSCCCSRRRSGGGSGGRGRGAGVCGAAGMRRVGAGGCLAQGGRGLGTQGGPIGPELLGGGSFHISRRCLLLCIVLVGAGAGQRAGRHLAAKALQAAAVLGGQALGLICEERKGWAG